MLPMGIFEIAMLLCFASAWPFSIYRSYKSRTTKGKSLVFMIVLVIGYLFGIANKFYVDDINYVLIFYILDICLVMTDVMLWIRNYRIDKKEKNL